MKMKIKIPSYLKEKEVWILRSILIICPAIFALIAKVYEFAAVWFCLTIFLLTCWDSYQIILEQKIERFK